MSKPEIEIYSTLGSVDPIIYDEVYDREIKNGVLRIKIKEKHNGKTKIVEHIYPLNSFCKIILRD